MIAGILESIFFIFILVPFNTNDFKDLYEGSSEIFPWVIKPSGVSRKSVIFIDITVIAFLICELGLEKRK